MASKKPKYNPDDVERWVTVRGARIPIMKDGSFGVGVEIKNENSIDKKQSKEVTSFLRKDSANMIKDVDAKSVREATDAFWNDYEKVEKLSDNIENDEEKGKFYAKYYDFAVKCREMQKEISPSGYGRYDVLLFDMKDRLRAVDYNFPYGWKSHAPIEFIKKQNSKNAKYDTSRVANKNPLQPKIQKKAGMVFAVSGEGNVLQSWKESEFTERKYQNFLKKLDAANPTRKK